MIVFYDFELKIFFFIFTENYQNLKLIDSNIDYLTILTQTDCCFSWTDRFLNFFLNFENLNFLFNFQTVKYSYLFDFYLINFIV